MAQMTFGKLTLPFVVALSAAALTSCDTFKSKRPFYDGVQFNIKTKPVDKKASRADFTVEVDDAGLSLEGARQAAYHAGVTYCLSKAGYGSSDIDWDVDPNDPESQLRLVDGAAVFRGKCDP